MHKFLEMLLAIAPMMGYALAAFLIWLSFELDYRWFVWKSSRDMDRKWRPKHGGESFLKYLWMDWFIRNAKWYEKQRNKQRP